jgi:uncharacterized membrane protein
MASPQEEIEALKSQIAALTARVYELEQRSGVASEAPQRPIPLPRPQLPAPPLAGTMIEPPSARVAPSSVPAAGSTPTSLPKLPQTIARPSAQPISAASHEDGDLEKRIGQYWLNRIGIVAMLVGISYFLKYAFDNNWIGPGGRVAIGLLVGIGLVLWSERFHRAWPEADLIITPDSGHSAFDPPNSRALIAATDKFAR